jgi:transcriptional regulator with XRE-family HTH domain
MSGVALDSFTTFGELLRYLRRRARLTQRELGLAVGYSEAQINRLESGLRLPDPRAVQTAFVEALELGPATAAAHRLLALASAAQRKAAANEAPLAPARGDQPQPPRHNLPTPLTNMVGRARYR